jgi:hypothetical protein
MSQYPQDASGYYSAYNAYDYKRSVYRDSYDKYPFNNEYRQNPFSDTSYIKPNVAGYYPIRSVYNRELEAPKQDPDYHGAFYYPCTTFFPKFEEYKKTREIILER